MGNTIDNTANYTSNSSIKKYWIEKIAPNYLDMDNSNLYNIGIFGYINEIMSNIVEDGLFSTNMVRREFYPSSAQYTQSLYKMASPHGIDLPMATPSKNNVILLIKQDDIINPRYGSINGNTKTVILDNNMVAMVGEIPFMLDYPIIILARDKGNGNYNYTVHYDFKYNNSISDLNDKYIFNKVITHNGNETYLLLNVYMHQVVKNSFSEPIIKNSVLDTYIKDIDFEGDIANFEVFYQENDNSPKIQLIKQLDGSQPIKESFCNYTFIGDNTLRIIIPYNIYFNPAFNSILTVDIYTTDAENGNYSSYDGDVICSFDNCDETLYNKEMIVLGVSQGASNGGKGKLDKDEFRQKIINAYSTNNTVTTANDLQVLFNQIADKYNKLVFNKKRDDCFNRLFGAYMLLRDEKLDIVPTNTCDIHITKDTINNAMINDNQFIIKPGSIFKYDSNKVYLELNNDLNIMSDLDEYEYGEKFDFIYTNPFLISGSLNPNTIGYYLNSCNHKVPLSFSYVNDESHMQFIANNLYINRNSLLGENFYKLYIMISPSTDLDSSTMFSHEEYVINAKKDGYVEKIVHIDGILYMILRYSDDETERIIINNFISSTNGKFEYKTGWNSQLNIGDYFKEGDILASSNITDLGLVRVMGSFDNYIKDLNYYIPFVLESYIPEKNFYKFSAVIEIDDTVSFDGKTNIISGLYDMSGNKISDPIEIEISNLAMELNVFYHDNYLNIPHGYDSYSYVTNYTLTNRYSQTKVNYFDLITPVKYIRSTMSYIDPNYSSENNYIIINESPIVKANWIKIKNNADYFYGKLLNNYSFIENVFYSLEQNFSIDLKFYNTYGISKFYNVGVANKIEKLNQVNCTFSFGIKLNSVTQNTESFIENFNTYVRNYIEEINSDTSISNSIYLINMCTEIKNNFDEIEYIEYYGMNSDYYTLNTDRDYLIQKIEAVDSISLINNGITKYVPEFINVFSIQKNGVSRPKIDITIL